jgi:ammonia channel protein AmtB
LPSTSFEQESRNLFEINIHIDIQILVIRFIAVDDPLDAVAVHFGGGFWGLIAASIFDNNGLVFGAVYESAMVRSPCITRNHRGLAFEW